jgi:hypothetical protein
VGQARYSVALSVKCNPPFGMFVNTRCRARNRAGSFVMQASSLLFSSLPSSRDACPQVLRGFTHIRVRLIAASGEHFKHAPV